jgi:predicted PurR-regulated permease PerM
LNPTARTSLTDLFRISSKDVLNYVFAHGFDAVEMGVLVFFYLVFLFLGSRRMAERVQRAFPGERGVRVVSIGKGISESMERFMVVKTVVGLGMGISSGLIMYLFGLDHWLLWAFLFFASNYITYIGSMAACVPPVVLAYLDLDSATTATILGILIILNRIFWIDFVELKMSGKQLNLDPTLMFLWLSYWGWAWGVLGLILAYPMMAAVKITLQHVVGAQGWALLLSDE